VRVQKTVGGATTTKYYHDGLNTVAEYNGSDQLLRTYVTPGLDQNLSLTASGSTYYVKDPLGFIGPGLSLRRSEGGRRGGPGG
jgi:hypothetical protein